MKILPSCLAFFALGIHTLSWGGPPGPPPLPTPDHISARSDHIEANPSSLPPMMPASIDARNAPVMALGDFQTPSRTVDKRGGHCDFGYHFCDCLDNCCAPDYYCTVDSKGQGACCTNGRICGGLSTPMPGLITGQPLCARAVTTSGPAKSAVIQPDPSRPTSTTPAPTISAVMQATGTADFKSPSPTLDKRAGICPGGLNFCDGPGNCCPDGNYCTVDANGRGACCTNGAICTGGSDPIPGLSVTLGPGLSATLRAGGGSLLRPARLFSFPVVLARFVKGAMLRSGNTTAETAPDLKFASANADQIFKANNTGGTTRLPQPLKMFGFADGLAKKAVAVNFSLQNAASSLEPKLKIIGANAAMVKARYQTNGGSGLPRPARIFAFSITLATHIKRALSSPFVVDHISNATENSATGPEDHKGGRLGGKGGGAYSGSVAPRPPRVFTIFIAFANHTGLCIISGSC